MKGVRETEPEVVSSIGAEGGGDPLYVLVDGPRVLLRADRYDDDTLTPAHARDLAHALQRAADLAERVDREAPRAIVRELVRLVEALDELEGGRLDRPELAAAKRWLERQT